MSIRSIPIATAPYAKTSPSGSDIRMAVEAIALILSVAEIDCARVINQISIDIDRQELLKALHNHLHDCNADVTGPIEKASEDLDTERYDGTIPGPFYRRRGA